MCPPLIAAIPLIGSSLATAGVAATATTAATAGTVLGMSATTAMAALSIASAATGLYASNQTAQAQADAIGVQRQNEADESLAIAEEKLGARVREGREKRARARVAAGESGALGASFAASINQSLSDENLDAALISKNLAFAQRGIDDRANSSLAGIRSPSALEAGLNIATAGIQGYNTGLSIESRTTKK